MQRLCRERTDGFSPAGRTVALAKSQREAFPFGALEGGFFTDPLGSGRPGQMKTTLNYSWQWFRQDILSERAYYLYEYMMAKQQGKEFYRFTSSASVNKNISKKLSLSSNINFTAMHTRGCAVGKPYRKLFSER